MARVNNNSAQILYTSTDYVQSLKTVESVEKAIANVERGATVKDFPRYIEAYTNLLERANATNDAPSNNKNMRNAQTTLTKKLKGLEQRAVAVSTMKGIAPPEKELFQRLKVNNELKKTSFERFKDDLKDDFILEGKWTWMRAAKYSAVAALAVLAAPQVLNAGWTLSGWLGTALTYGPKVAQNGGEVLTGGIAAATAATQAVGTAANGARDFLGMPPAPNAQADGGALLTSVGVNSFFTAGLVKVVDPILPKALTGLFQPAVVAATICNHLDPTCTQSITDRTKTLANAIGELEKADPAGFYAVGAFLTGMGTYNKDAIAKFFSSATTAASGYTGYGVMLYSLAKMIDAQNPGFFRSVGDKVLPLLPEVPKIGVNALDKALEIRELNPQTTGIVANTATLAASLLGYVHPAVPIATVVYNSEIIPGIANAIANDYKNNGPSKYLADAGSPILPWLNQTLNNPTQWQVDQWLSTSHPEILETTQWSLGLGSTAAWISSYIPSIKRAAEAAATLAGNAEAAKIAAAEPDVITLRTALGVVTGTRRVVSAAAKALVQTAKDTARKTAGDLARSNYLSNAKWRRGILFALIPPAIQGVRYGVPFAWNTAKNSCTNPGGHCYRVADAAATKIASGVLFVGTGAFSKYRGDTNLVALGKSITMAALPILGNVAYTTSPIVRESLDWATTTVYDKALNGPASVVDAAWNHPVKSTMSGALFVGGHVLGSTRHWSYPATAFTSSTLASVPFLANAGLVAYGVDPDAEVQKAWNWTNTKWDNGVEYVSTKANDAWEWTAGHATSAYNTVTGHPVASVLTVALPAVTGGGMKYYKYGNPATGITSTLLTPVPTLVNVGLQYYGVDPVTEAQKAWEWTAGLLKTGYDIAMSHPVASVSTVALPAITGGGMKYYKYGNPATGITSTLLTPVPTLVNVGLQYYGVDPVTEAQKAWKWTTGLLKTGYDIAMSHPVASVSTVALPAITGGGMKYYKYGNLATGITSTLLTPVPTLVEVGRQAYGAQVSAGLQRGWNWTWNTGTAVADTSYKAVTDNAEISSGVVGAVAAAVTALKTPKVVHELAGRMARVWVPNGVPNAASIRNAAGYAGKKVAQVGIPVVAGLATWYGTYKTLLLGRPSH